MEAVSLVAEIAIDAGALLQANPLRFTNQWKRALFEQIKEPLRGEVAVTRWRGVLPHLWQAEHAPGLEMREEAFDYAGYGDGTAAWYVNFADRDLFGYYSGPLLAQDEH